MDILYPHLGLDKAHLQYCKMFHNIVKVAPAIYKVWNSLPYEVPKSLSDKHLYICIEIF